MNEEPLATYTISKETLPEAIFVNIRTQKFPWHDSQRHNPAEELPTHDRKILRKQPSNISTYVAVSYHCYDDKC